MVLNVYANGQIRFAFHLSVSSISIISIQSFFVDSALTPAPAPPSLFKIFAKILRITSSVRNLFFLIQAQTPLPTDPFAQPKATANVAFGLPFGYTSYFNNHIDHLLKNATNLEQQLQESAVYYGVAIEEIIDSLDDINDDNMTALGGPAATASLASSDFDAAFRGSHNSPLAAMNRRMRLFFLIK